MSDPLPDENAGGRPIWFVRDDGSDGGTYRPVTRQGCRAFVLAALWVVGCGSVGMIGFADTLDWRWFAGMFVVGAAGLLVFARTVKRHS